MTDDQINQRIAKACGWADVHFSLAATDEFPTSRRVVGIPAGHCTHDVVPNYCSDLNAMHEAEKALHPSQPTSMRHWLEALCKKRKLGNFWQAPARERAEAFLRVLDRWEEVQG